MNSWFKQSISNQIFWKLPSFNDLCRFLPRNFQIFMAGSVMQAALTDVFIFSKTFPDFFNWRWQFKLTWPNSWWCWRCQVYLSPNLLIICLRWVSLDQFLRDVQFTSWRSIHFVTFNSFRDDQFNSWRSIHFVTFNSFRDVQFNSWRSILFVMFVMFNSFVMFSSWTRDMQYVMLIRCYVNP